MTKLFDKLTLSKNDGNRSASSRNNNSKSTFRKNDSNNEVDRFGISENGMEYAKKSGKLSKSRKSKSKKIFKS